MLTVKRTDSENKAARAISQHYEVLKELADCYTALGDYDRSRECYLQATELAPAKAGPHVGLGIVAIQLDRLDEAEREFHAASDVEPDCAEAYSGLAMIYQEKKDYPSAFEMYMKCLELDSDNLVALLGMFQTSCQMGTFSKVIHYLEIYLDRHPGDTSVLFCLATLYAREGKLTEARTALQTVLALEPEKEEAADLLTKVEKNLARTQPQGMANV